MTITVKPATGPGGGGGGGTMATTAVAGAALPITYGTSGSVSVTLAPVTATGSVELSKGGTVLGAAAVVDGSATVALAATSLPVGEHVLALRYGGDASHRASSAAVTVTVVAPTTRRSTSRTVAKVDPRKLSYRENFRIVAVVRSIMDGSPTPTGKVKVRIDGRRIDVGRLHDGRYVLKVKRDLNRGRHMLSVTYTGDSTTWWSRDRQWFWVGR